MQMTFFASRQKVCARASRDGACRATPGSRPAMPLQWATYIDFKHAFVNVPGSCSKPKMSVREPGPLDTAGELRQLQVASRRSLDAFGVAGPHRSRYFCCGEQHGAAGPPPRALTLPPDQLSLRRVRRHTGAARDATVRRAGPRGLARRQSWLCASALFRFWGAMH